jgi:hypothetical protein
MIAKTFLALVLVMPTTMQAYERGKVERFATLPAGEAHPEGICRGPRGQRVRRHRGLEQTGLEWRNTDCFRSQREAPADRHHPRATPWLLDLRFHPHTGKLLVIDYKGGKVLSVDP